MKLANRIQILFEVICLSLYLRKDIIHRSASFQIVGQTGFFNLEGIQLRRRKTQNLNQLYSEKFSKYICINNYQENVLQGTYIYIYIYHFSQSTLERTLVVPSFSPGVSGRDIHFPLVPHMWTKISDLRFSLVIFNYQVCIGLAIRRLSSLFIYLFNFLWAVQVCYIYTDWRKDDNTSWWKYHLFFFVYLTWLREKRVGIDWEPLKFTPGWDPLYSENLSSSLYPPMRFAHGRLKTYHPGLFFVLLTSRLVHVNSNKYSFQFLYISRLQRPSLSTPIFFWDPFLLSESCTFQTFFSVNARPTPRAA